MKNENFKPISVVSRMFEMSQVWLNQLRIAGYISTVVAKSPKGKQIILYCVDDVEKWIKDHAQEYEDRKRMGDHTQFTGYK
ncbi:MULTISPECIES: hypothetical protein [Bacteroidales]|uniref:hypothetical protein n=1 Tax=Bacteroidales TaxID=171549 RepID=UPI0025B71588|nr:MULTISPECIES: hypothetical protein [Bacteroidales]